MRGRILPIGGLKEKLLAAHRGQIKKVLVPKENEKDLKEIPKRILKQLEIVLVENVDRVLQEALVLEDPSKLFKKTAGEDVGSLVAKKTSPAGAATSVAPH